MKKFFRSLNVKLQYARVALRKINMPHLGDTVTYKDTECSLIQGVAKPRWDLLPLTKENLDKPKREIWRNVHENEFKMQPFIKRFRFSFMSTYRFYMTNWYSIDMNKRGRISFIQTY
jgi:hypothetical protein